MKQTVFNYPDSKTSLEIIDLIFDGKIQEAYDILTDFYGISVRLKVKCDSVLFAKDMNKIKSSFPNVAGYYDYTDISVNFRSMRDATMPHVALHEYYHYLESAYDIRGNGTGNNQTADSWAEWFVKSIDDIGDIIIYMFGTNVTSIFIMSRVTKFLKAVKNKDPIDKIRKFKKYKGILNTKEVFYSQKDKKYYITPLGEMLLKYGMQTLNNLVPDWEQQLEKFEQLLKNEQSLDENIIEMNEMTSKLNNTTTEIHHNQL